MERQYRYEEKDKMYIKKWWKEDDFQMEKLNRLSEEAIRAMSELSWC